MIVGVFVTTAEAVENLPGQLSACISLKIPGNNSRQYPLTFLESASGKGCFSLEASQELPLVITERVRNQSDCWEMEVTLTALDDIYFNFSQQLSTSFRHGDCQFYMPGFWYRQNLRSPQGAPAFHTSDSWEVREDRLSTPLTGIYNVKDGQYLTVIRKDDFCHDALTTHSEGEVILSGKTSIGFTGFANHNGKATLSFGFPYREAPKSYVRKLTLAPEVEAYQKLGKGETVMLTWEIAYGSSDDFSGFVRRTWEYSYDMYRPQPVSTSYSSEKMKEVMSNYFVESFIDGPVLSYYASPRMHVLTCDSPPVAEVGFVGRVLLNAFNAWEYGYGHDRQEVVEDCRKIFGSYLENGFTPGGFFRERVSFINDPKGEDRPANSIRRQSEAVYAMLHYLDYERANGRKHPEWEHRLRNILDMFLKIQNADGSFPRKFKDDFTITDKSGGSTPSATLPLVMAYKYFKDKRYLESAKHTADYLEKELISKADYFSSTLDANCEDKEASLYAATATYYLALITKGEERKHYADLTREAAYFALSWYYVWDVPFADGEMLGDLGFKTRGWGNVSVENNHIDVFVFEFGSVLDWLAKEYDETRFSAFSNVISTSMRQLLPYEGHLCGVAKVGYYPEVVQHTNWDYGKNGKGYYNNIFAPGWTVASLWELLTPGRAEKFMKD